MFFGIYNDAIAGHLTIKRMPISVNASQSNSTLIAAVPTKKIRVIAISMTAGATATTVTLQSNATAIGPATALAINGGICYPPNPLGWFETVAGEALKVTTGAGSTTGYQILYVEA